MLYVGNMRTKQIHRPECSRGKQMQDRNRITFNTLEEALSRNYEGCCYCLKQFDRNSGYIRDKVKRFSGTQMAGKIGYEANELKKIDVVYQEGGEHKSKTAISLRSLFTFPDQSLQDDTGEVKAEKDKVEFLEKKGTEKNVWSFAKDGAVMRFPVKEDVAFFSARVMVPSVKGKDSRTILLMTGPRKMPVRVYLNTNSGKYTVSLKLKTSTATIQSESEGYDFQTDKWHTITVVITSKEIDILADGKKCVSRHIFMTTPDVTQEGPDCFTVGYDKTEAPIQFRGYLSTFEYNSEIKENDSKLILKAAEAGMGEIELCYEKQDGGVSLGKLIQKGSYKDGGLYAQYQNGSIYWSKNTEAVCVREPILKLYKSYDGPEGPLGYPKYNAVPGATAGVQVQQFEDGAIYYKTQGKGGYGGGIKGKPWHKYYTSGADAMGIGLPCPTFFNRNDRLHAFDSSLDRGFYRSTIMKARNEEATEFDFSYIYYTDNENATAAFLPAGPLSSYYFANNRMAELGYPLSDRAVMHERENGIKDCVMIFENGIFFWQEDGTDEIKHPVLMNGNFMREYYTRGGYNKFGMPLRRSRYGKTEFMDCENATFVEHNYEVYCIDEIEFSLVDAVSKSIDDAINSTAELSYHLTLKASNDRVKDDSQLVNINGRYSRSKSKNRTFPKECTFRMKVSGTSTIYFFVQYEDYDPESKNDYLGSVRRTLSAENLWGLTGLRIAPGYPMEGGEELELDDYGNDAKKNKKRTVLTTYSVKQMDGPMYVLDPDTFRVDSWWRFNNFSNASVLDQNFVASVFRDMANVSSTWDKICNPLDSLFYLAVKHAGDHGNCFGFCLGALEAYYNTSRFRMPVKSYMANSIDAEFLSKDTEVDLQIRNYLQKCQLKQWSLSSVLHMTNQFITRRTQNPVKVFYDVEEEIRKNQFSIITMLNIADGFAAHAVLAYRTERFGNMYRIYVADPNFSSRMVVRNDADPNITYNDINWVEIDPKKNTFQYIVPNSARNGFAPDPVYRTSTSGKGGFDGLMFSTPFSTFAGKMLTPSWYILGGVLTGGLTLAAIIGLIGSANCVEIDCDGSPAKTDNNGIIPLVPPGGSSDVQLFLVTKPASSYTVKYKGSGKVKQIVETPQRIFTVETELAKGETAVVSAVRGKDRLPELTVSGIKNKQISMEIRNKALGEYRENAEKVEMQMDTSGKAALKLNMLTGSTGIQGAKKGNITLLKQVRSAGDTIEASKLTIDAKGNEEIRVTRPKLFALKDVLVERVDPKTDKVKTREKYTFKKK